MNFTFKAPQASDTVVASWPLSTVIQQLGLAEIKLQDRGNGKFAIFIKPDGTYSTCPVSKEMTAEQFPSARLVQFKTADNSDLYIVCRENGTALASIKA